MICKLHLSKVLKVSHETKSTLTRNGLVTVIIFKDLNMQAALININPRDNTIQLGINDGEWDIYFLAEKLANDLGIRFYK